MSEKADIIKKKTDIQNNSEILFIYEAKLTNPNGDPDDENRPRMDPKTKRNLVTDVRLKRYFRDYIIANEGEQAIWVTKIEGKNVDATTRIDSIRGGKPENVLEQCIDARLFGATIPLKGKDKSRGDSVSYTGPVQFTWGYSLHKVDMVDSRSITSLFSGRDTGYGNIGKDYRVYYSMIAFHGAVSAKRAEFTGATQEDLKTLDDGLWNAITTETVTRSKLGQRPLLYVRVEYSKPEFMSGDLRRFVHVKEKGEAVRDFSDLDVDTSKLKELLGSEHVVKAYVRCSEEFKNFCEGLPSKVQKLPHQGNK
ncbi:type I-B CRISPR-associated protein Cas7/Csh2 [Sulfuracidifex metallicus]|uniref:Type I-B CRISPR-associated protein Cas7/Csh2 n=1 Tax=Sulfuracidifex metallicus DSM 6482 = JCM 9184 TaxID=523847 RepID=A0A6A9QPP9_SULME|nr:type I-B CRISPR-associated protein Cas7/Csh2 [Sulfuracidifex metallicus]MUN29728.1 type I-B CRISPR-associated protein Cas7/Csh2 [Sulfuracidifex metallicus DSM 6482 = JCM 9184]WOE49759.1 type I-B CRISPR-associated protein Cas7/Csh2 [Sulfuracidifex metallicus DSM 6482 = JCM 9184]